MDENCNMVCGIDKLAELLIERGIEFCVNDEVSLAFKDDVGNLHECWMAGADENRVNALIVVTPEQLLSVPDLNGIIAENAKLRSLASELYQQVLQDDAAWRDVRAWEDGLPSDCLHPIRSYDDSLGKYMAAHKFEKRMCELGIEVRHV